MPDQYHISISITLVADEAKKDAVRDWLNTQLVSRRADGTILSASISISRTAIPEQVIISPL